MSPLEKRVLVLAVLTMKIRPGAAIIGLLGFALGIAFQRDVGISGLLIHIGLRKEPAQSSASVPRMEALGSLPTSPGSIILCGDSLVEFEEWREALGSPHIINRGIAGAKIGDITGRFDFTKARAIVCLIGINDLGDGATAEDFKQRYTRFVATLPDNVPFYAISVPAVAPFGDHVLSNGLIEDCNSFIKTCISRRQNSHYVDIFGISKKGGAAFFAPDGLHFSAEGYREILETFRREMPELWASERN